MCCQRSKAGTSGALLCFPATIRGVALRHCLETSRNQLSETTPQLLRWFEKRQESVEAYFRYCPDDGVCAVKEEDVY